MPLLQDSSSTCGGYYGLTNMSMVALGILRRLLRHQPGLLLDQHGSRYDATVRRHLDELGLDQLHQDC